MSDEYAFTKTYPDREHFLDAVYRLWMMPEMTKRIHVIGGLKYDIEFEEHTSVYACEGIREKDFCSLFHYARITSIDLEQRYKNSENTIFICAKLSTLQIHVFGAGAKDFALCTELKKKMDDFPKTIPAYSKECFPEQRFSKKFSPSMTKDDVMRDLICQIKEHTGLAKHIFVAGEGFAPYHPLQTNEPVEDILWLYAYDDNKNRLVTYDKTNDVYAAVNFLFRPKGDI